MNQKKLLIADDSELNRAILMNMLEHDYEIIEATNGREAVAALRSYEGEIGALLLDLLMPEMNGFEVLAVMNQNHWIENIPTIIISTETSPASIDRAFRLGVSDYISRPFIPSVVRQRIINTVLLQTKKQQLLGMVSEQFDQQEKNNALLVSILGYAVEYRSGESGSHMSNVSHLTELLLKRLLQKTDVYAVPYDDVETICTAAGLHDIGKLLVPEEILTKPGALTPVEFDVIKRHPTLGANMITSLPLHQDDKLVKYAIEICHWHHERWDGRGYPDHLKGDEIPIAAQVVSLADVYDALVSKRCYKDAYSPEKAMQMIHNGECGVFNPILLECLDEIAPTLKEEAKLPPSLAQAQYTAQRAIEDLYQGRNLSAARMTQELESSFAKQSFFLDLSHELWFEYTTQPPALNLYHALSEQTGLPSVIVDPLNDPQFKAVAGAKLIEQISDRVRNLTVDEQYFEMESQLVLKGELCWCKLALLITWSTTEPGQCKSIMGKVQNINDRYARLAQYQRDLHVPAREQSSSQSCEDNLMRVTGEQLPMVFQRYRNLFQTVRLVDPVICMQVSVDSEISDLERNNHCYAVWQKERRCDHCISQETVRTHRPVGKVEAIGNEIYYVIASCIEVDGEPYALECVNPIHFADTLDGTGEDNVINQLLIRNRQVYIDSITKVFSRRYYDDRLRDLTGEFAFAMLDIDDFKQINDQYGHMIGDAVLYQIAQTIRSAIRSKDELVRYGGDEFFLLFRSLPQHVLEERLQVIVQAVSELRMPECPDLRITLSIGGAYSHGKIASIIHEADYALYQAKKQKNCVVVYANEEDLHDNS